MQSKRQEYNYNNKKDLKKEVCNIGEKYSYYVRYLLGRGATSTVYLGFIQQTQEEIAVKLLKKEIDIHFFDLEVDILKKLNHPNIIRCIDDISVDGQRFIILEYCHSVSLTRYITFNSHVNEKRAFLFFSQIVEAMKHLREHQIVHRDLKPDNILITKKDKQPFIKLIDFGYAKILEEGEFAHSYCGTPSFMAPEVLRGNGYTETADVWSLGCILYNLLYGVPPFQDKRIQDTISRFQSPLENFQLPEKGVLISQSCGDLIVKLLTYDHITRISFNDLCNHHWLTSFPKSLSKSKTLANSLLPSVHNIPVNNNNNNDNNINNVNNEIDLKKSQIKKSQQQIIEEYNNDNNNENNNENGQVDNTEDSGDDNEDEDEEEGDSEMENDKAISERIESDYSSETMYSSHETKIGNKIETIIIKHNFIKIVNNYLDNIEENVNNKSLNNNNNNINNVNSKSNFNIKVSTQQMRSDEYINKAIGFLQQIILNTQSKVVWKILPAEKSNDQISVLWKWTSIYYSHRRFFAIQSCFFFIYYYRIIAFDSEYNDDQNNQHYYRNNEEVVIPLATCSLSYAKKTLAMLKGLEAQLGNDTRILFQNLYRLPSSNFADYLTKSNFASASSLLSSSTLNSALNNNNIGNM